MKDKRNITVFLGSSSDFDFRKGNSSKKRAMRAIVDRIESSFPNVRVKPWWIWNYGDTFILDHVTTNITASDLCIFILSDDEKRGEKTKDKKVGESINDSVMGTVPVPNSNVLIEIGIAFAKGKRVMLINWPPCNVSIPSDLAGKLYTKGPIIKRDTIDDTTIVSNFRKMLADYVSNRTATTSFTQYKDIKIYYDTVLANELCSPIPPQDWGTKALYVGAKSAKLWSLIEGNHYPETSTIKRFLEEPDKWDNGAQIDSINDIVVDNIISFGPGAGSIDSKLITYFARDKYKPYYIPIDINISLITMVIDRLTKKESFPVPFAILDDFEKGACFDRLNALIDAKEYEIHKRNLFSIVGVTFSNYSEDENFFLKRIASIMRPEDDFLLLDVVVGSLSEKELKKRVKKQLSGKNKPLIVHSIRKRFNNIHRELSDEVLFKRVKYECPNENRYKEMTNLHKTKIVECTYNDDETSGPLTLLLLKQYDYEEFKEYLKGSFEIVASSLDEKNKRGVFLLRSKS